ncbi:hypothetical protein [Cupriavidus basilensis]|uniref:hypothetical protein n=1 Tax=Cupriavidus basilensis TaxID=68895 RepID=UPI0039F6C59C
MIRDPNGAQLPLALTTPGDLERFGIPHLGSRITYGDVSRHMRRLRIRGRMSDLADLVDVAAELFRAPEWRQQLATWSAKENQG